jgi:DUF3048 family protein
MSTKYLKWFVAGIWIVTIIFLGALIASGALATVFQPGVQVPSLFVNGNAGAASALPPASLTPLSPVVVATAVPAQTQANVTPPTPYPTLTPFALPTLNSPLLTYNIESGVDPLTGLTVDDPTILDRRPIAVKIVNYPRHSARPVQSGLSIADVVYEHYIEDGISRYVGIFYGKDAQRAGAVRSGRFFDEHLMRMYHALLVYANMDDRVQNYFFSGDLLPYLIPPRDDNCPPLCRDPKITGYNNVFLDTGGVRNWLQKYSGVDNVRQNLRNGFFSGALLPWMGKDAQRVFVRFSGYSYNYWEYDENLAEYIRFQDTSDAIGGAPETYEPLYDMATGEHVAFDNLVVLLVNHTYYNKKAQVFEINLVNTGTAFLFREGRVYEGRWVRDQLDQPIVITDPAGNPYAMKPGRTFYEVLTDLTTYVQDGSDWRFRFVLPP